MNRYHCWNDIVENPQKCSTNDWSLPKMNHPSHGK